MSMEIIAFYLPQYHPTPHNDEWWGEGFTEWTNVAKAKPFFCGHYQPKIPSSLGFYDLRIPEVREKQVELAVKAGVTCFCYYHYWFGDGHVELELPFNEVVKSGEPDFPFMLCWANETWSRKFWNKDGTIVDSKLLAEQKYLGEEDDIKHFYTLLPAFKDKRYLRIDGKLAFMIYRPLSFVEMKRFIDLWQKLAKENGLEGFHFMGFSFKPDQEGGDFLNLGLDAVVAYRHNRDFFHNWKWAFRKIFSIVFRLPRVQSYKKIWPTLISDKEQNDEQYYPVMLPNWDHTPRSGHNGDVLIGSTPEEFEKHCIDVLSKIKNKKHDICFLKSWNEWGEGNYMEPDLKYGKGYIHALRNAINKETKK